MHYGLFGATILMIGDDAQATRWLPQVERCEMLGCFALTQLGHGRNVNGIDTITQIAVTTYNVATKQFINNYQNPTRPGTKVLDWRGVSKCDMEVSFL